MQEGLVRIALTEREIAKLLEEAYLGEMDNEIELPLSYTPILSGDRYRGIDMLLEDVQNGWLEFLLSREVKP
jgi:hypothetical protein